MRFHSGALLIRSDKYGVRTKTTITTIRDHGWYRRIILLRLWSATDSFSDNPICLVERLHQLLFGAPASRVTFLLCCPHLLLAPSCCRRVYAVARVHFPTRVRLYDLVAFPLRLLNRQIPSSFSRLAIFVERFPQADAWKCPYYSHP